MTFCIHLERVRFFAYTKYLAKINLMVRKPADGAHSITPVACLFLCLLCAKVADRKLPYQIQLTTWIL